ncbi:hypothetical protein FHR32_000936 [Streptosporangium album]|uniref:CDP-alcohol phosphatidyltransferase n=1 Tax=Streptosporangium album TaxID=47479 RepID=A0A7W7W7C2_9ACTN|nr:hypothetical protein [Streptosporangium album]MBB4936631.1 hypothetical protein [Streptosporangium album]
MPPISQVALGFLVTFIAIRINGFDLLVDAVGWAAVASGLSRLETTVDRGFAGAKVSAVVACLVSILLLFGPTRAALITTVYTVVSLLTVWLIATVVMRRAQARGDISTAQTFNVIRLTEAIVQILAVAVLVVGGPGGIVIISGIIGFVVYIWFVVSLIRLNRLPYFV